MEEGPSVSTKSKSTRGTRNTTETKAVSINYVHYLHGEICAVQRKAMKSKYDQVMATRQTLEADLNNARERIKQLGSEKDLLIDALCIVAPHQPEFLYWMEEMTEPPPRDNHASQLESDVANIPNLDGLVEVLPSYYRKRQAQKAEALVIQRRRKEEYYRTHGLPDNERYLPPLGGLPPSGHVSGQEPVNQSEESQTTPSLPTRQFREPPALSSRPAPTTLSATSTPPEVSTFPPPPADARLPPPLPASTSTTQ